MSQYRSEDIFRCVCGHDAHYFTVSSFEYGDSSIEDSQIYITVCLSNSFSFWRRLWEGIKYVFFNKRIQFEDVILDLHDQEYLVDRIHRHYIKHINNNKVNSQDEVIKAASNEVD